MSVYLIGDTQITDPEAYEAYKAAVRPIAERHGGVYRVRGGRTEVWESDLWTPTRVVVIEFPDAAAASAFYDDPAYQPHKQTRRGAANCTFFMVEGL